MTGMTRRSLLAATPLLAAPLLAHAEAPGRDVSFLIPYAPGGGFDLYVRTVIPAMQKALGVTIVPNNVEGAGGARAANMLDRARPDGATIGVLNIPGLLLLDGLGFDVTKLSWIGNLGRDPYGLAVAMDSPIKSMADLQALSKKRPVRFTSTGTASAGYIATLIAANLLDIRPQMINGYKGTTDYVVAAVRGDGDAAVCSLTALSSFVAGKLVRVIATFEDHASIPGAEDATSLHQPDLTKITQYRPVAAPPKLPAGLQTSLADALATAMRDPAVQEWAHRNNANLDPLSPAQTAQALREQIEFVARWKPRLAAG